MEYYTCVINTDFDKLSGNVADYVFGVRQDFRDDFINILNDLEQKYNCSLYLSQSSCIGHYWNFDDLDEVINYLDDLLAFE